MHLPCDLTPKLLSSLLSTPFHRRCSWNMRGRLSSSGTKPTAAPSQPWTSGTSWSPSGRTCSHPSWRNASWRWVFVWLRGSLFHLFYCCPQEPKSGWLKIVRSVAAAHLGVRILCHNLLRNCCCTNWVFFIQQHLNDKLGQLINRSII